MNKKQVISITYLGKDGHSRESYYVEPYTIASYDGYWYLICIIEINKCLRKFKLEKILSCTPTEKCFTPKKEVLKLIDESRTIWFDLGKKKKVTMLVNKEVSHLFKTQEYFPRQKIVKTNEDGSIIIESTITRDEEVLHKIFHWIPHVHIISPKELKGIAMEKVRKFMA